MAQFYKNTPEVNREIIKSILTDKRMSARFTGEMKDLGVLTDSGGIGDLSSLDPIANTLLEYTALANEFISTLFNKVAKTFIQEMGFENPLAELKTGDMPLGSFIEEVHVNPIAERDYDPSGARLLDLEIADVKVAYHQLNRQKSFPLSINRQLLKRAFTSFASFGELINHLIGKIYSSNEIVEFMLTKQLMGSAVTNGKIVTKESVNPLTSVSDAKEFTKIVRALVSKFKFPNTIYNAYQQYPDADKNISRVSLVDNRKNIKLITTSDIIAQLDVELLSVAFHMDKAEIYKQIIEIDQFEDADGTPMPGVHALVADRSYFQIYDQDKVTADFFNADNLVYKTYLHVFQSWGVSPFANAVALVDNNLVWSAP